MARGWIAFLPALVLAACSAPFHVPVPRPGPPELRVMTLNFKNVLLVPGDDDERMRRVVEALETHRPDLVSLQEIVTAPTQANGAASLAERAGYRWRWHATHGHPLVGLEGPAILARGRIVELEARPLPHRDLEGRATRVALGARVATPLGEIYFYATHMTVEEDGGVKADQAAALARFVAERPAGVPAIVAGDLNATPDSLALRVLRGEASRAGVRGTLVDAWPETRPEDPGATYPANDPERRIDYVLSTVGDAQALVPVECRKILDEPEREDFASDHVGLLCVFAPGAPLESTFRAQRQADRDDPPQGRGPQRVPSLKERRVCLGEATRSDRRDGGSDPRIRHEPALHRRREGGAPPRRRDGG